MTLAGQTAVYRKDEQKEINSKPSQQQYIPMAAYQPPTGQERERERTVFPKSNGCRKQNRMTLQSLTTQNQTS
jgi:hypothetical protein